ncbi:MAG: hypothetical protein ACRDY4_15930 [Acidimicrobiia bacterium]
MVGFAAVAVPRLLDSDDDSFSAGSPRVALSDLADARDPATPLALGPGEAEPPAPASATPDVAVDAFLTAEARRDYATSYGLLSAADRDEIGSRKEWAAAHGELETVTSFVLGPVRALDAASAEVEAGVTFESTLDETRGLVPARARATWVAVAEDGGWRVARSRSRVTPQYPDEQGAVSAAAAWVGARKSCDRSMQYEDGLVGVAAPVERLCDARGPVRVGAVAPLEPDAGVEPFLAAFGPEVLSWARVVPTTSPVPMAVVLAPVADTWLVIGTLESSPDGSS